METETKQAYITPYGDEFETWEDCIQGRVRYIGRLISSRKRRKPCYAFGTEDQRDNWIISIVDKSAMKEKKKLAAQAARAAFVNPVQAGDVFYCMWGYDQTNVDWYQVTQTGARSVMLRPLCERIEESGPLAMQGRSFPERGNFKGPEFRKTFTIRADGSWRLPMKHGHSLDPYTDDRGKHCSWYC